METIILVATVVVSLIAIVFTILNIMSTRNSYYKEYLRRKRGKH